MLPLQKTLIEPHELTYIHQALDGGRIYPMGIEWDEFQKELTTFLGAQWVLPVASGTAALEVALKVSGVSPNDLVICPDLNFAAGPNMVRQCGATPVFVDVDPNTFAINPILLKQALEDLNQKGTLPKALIVVHAFGIPADMDSISKLCDTFDIQLIEDSAGAFGSRFQGESVGLKGRMGAFSFNGNKLISCGSGGAIVFQSESDFKLAEQLINQGKNPKTLWYEHDRPGMNYRLNNINAALGLGQLKNIKNRLLKKSQIHTFYRELFSNLNSFTPMPTAQFGTSNHWLNFVQVNASSPLNALQWVECFRSNQIEASPMWKPMSQQPAFADSIQYLDGTSHQLFQSTFCLPSGHGTTDADLNQIHTLVHR